MKAIANHIGAEDECIKVYNPAKQEMLRVFDTYTQAARYLGITDTDVKSASLSKKRKFSPLLNMEVAIRVTLKTDADRKLIRKTIKHSAG